MLQQEKCDTREPAPIISRTLTQSPGLQSPARNCHVTITPYSRVYTRGTCTVDTVQKKDIKASNHTIYR